ncbi:DegV family protein [Lapidilactobacillus gannanensis]|jgi:DegV family protein with EDD domain|uniref:DegV family protein n=2 Tax=Lapidilactobacillus gannanensis TaxID=2486002 RepID=A0ABW4BQZ4_9LACO|nr:DegV family protein [Lapidilactobacillus gannanensis]MCH4057806.1 DegV family protein [Lactobacillaceae bacterium]
MMKVAVMTDSAAYLKPEEVQRYHINILPIPIIWGDETLLDMVDVGQEQFYDRLRTDPVLPTSSQPSIGQVEAIVSKLVAAGYEALIAPVISSGISSFYNNLKAYAEREKRLKIYPFDTHITCAGTAYSALLAGKMAQAGANPEKILAALAELRETTGVYFEVDDLSHLRRTGRLSNASSFVAGLLKIKPILTIDINAKGKGQITAIAKERQAKRAFEWISSHFAAAIADKEYPIRCTIFDANAPEVKAEWLQEFTKRFPQVKFDTSIIGPVIGVHTGEKAMSMIWARDWETM